MTRAVLGLEKARAGRAGSTTVSEIGVEVNGGWEPLNGLLWNCFLFCLLKRHRWDGMGQREVRIGQ